MTPSIHSQYGDIDLDMIAEEAHAFVVRATYRDPYTIEHGEPTGGGPFGTKHDPPDWQGPLGTPPLSRCGACRRRFYHHEVRPVGDASTGIMLFCYECREEPDA